jgi:hypothetical protein
MRALHQQETVNGEGDASDDPHQVIKGNQGGTGVPYLPDQLKHQSCADMIHQHGDAGQKLQPFLGYAFVGLHQPIIHKDTSVSVYYNELRNICNGGNGEDTENEVAFFYLTLYDGFVLGRHEKWKTKGRSVYEKSTDHSRWLGWPYPQGNRIPVCRSFQGLREVRYI